VEENPVWFCAEGDVAELVNLKEGEGECEEGGGNKIEGEVDSRHGEEKDVGKEDEDMMKRHDPFPTEAGEECDAPIFLVLRKGLKILDDEICESEKCQWNGNDDERMGLCVLKCE